MSWLTALFIVVVLAGLAVEWWLSGRQIAAVQAHRDRVPQPFAAEVSAQEHRKAADYTRATVRLRRIGAALDAALTLAFTVGGGIAAIDALWRGSGLREPWLGAAVIGTVAAVALLITLPVSLWRTFTLEAHFGFNRTTPALFLADLGRNIALAVLLGGPLVLATLWLMMRAGQWWWLWVFACWLLVTLVITWAWPSLIAPLFNRFSPLKDQALKERIEALLARCGFRSSGVFVIDGSRRSSHGNAYFSGIGRNKRIVFFDTLLGLLEPPEIEAVLAHELGHFRLKHVRSRLLASIGGMLVGFALLGWLAAKPQFYHVLGVPRPSAHAALLLFALAAPAVLFFVTPLTSLWSRRHEFEADRFAARHAHAPDLVSALVKLYRSNASTLTPDRLYAAFHYSHPPAMERIDRLNRTGASTRWSDRAPDPSR